MTKNTKPLLDILQRKKPERVPFWLMRQAGRYLPEYRALRANAGSFLDLVYHPEQAAEVTLQPLRRFGMDGAILFSDILVVPHALGQSVRFETGEGPKLDPVRTEEDLIKLDLTVIERTFETVYETVSRVRAKMAQEGFNETALIGFCGSPWTVICYMVQGGGSRDFEAARNWAMRDPDSFQKLVDIVTEASCVYLAGQIRAGAEIIQLFESWAGIHDSLSFDRWVIEPTKKIRAFLKKEFPDIPVIGFPRGAGTLSLAYAKETGIDAIGLDQSMDLGWAASNLQTLMPVQGNLDPMRLLTGGAALEEGMAHIYKSLSGSPFIFNLGHGVIKETDIAHVENLARIVRSWRIS